MAWVRVPNARITTHEGEYYVEVNEETSEVRKGDRISGPN